MRFGRKQHDTIPEDSADAEVEPSTGADPSQPALPASGPFDESEVTDIAADGRIDLGALRVPSREGVELRLQVDESTSAVAAAMLVTSSGAAELRAFAAPRNGSIWADVRKSIAAEAARQGGTATEAQGMWGTELELLVQGQDDKGRTVTQPSRIVGIDGPRWLLRVTFFGRPAEAPDPGGDLESAVRDVVVVRGAEARAPGEPLVLTLPPGAQRLAQPPAG